MKKTASKTFLICGLILLIGSSLSLGLYYSIQDSNEFKRDKILTGTYDLIHNGIQREIERNLNSLYALRAHYIAHGAIERKQFSSYASYYTTKIKSIQALEWVPKITLSERDSFELATRQEGFPNFEITTKQGDSLIRAEPRDIYYPVYFIEPYEGNEAAFGYDPGKVIPTRENSIQKAISTGHAAASDIFPIVQKDYPHKAIVVFVPIYEDDQKGIIGLIEGVYLIDRLIEVALSEINLPRSVEVTIFNKDTGRTVLFGKQIPKETGDNNSRSGDLTIADRSWNLQAYYADESELSGIEPLWILVASLLFTLLVVKVVYDTLSDNSKELAQYVVELEKKNQDLEQYAYVASHDLQEPLHSMQSLVTLVDEEYHSKLDQQGQLYLNYIKEASIRMSSLITNLLHHNRIGHMERIEDVDCNQLIDQIMLDLGTLIKSSNTSIIRNSKLPIVKGYPIALYQLFQNLISNAIKFHEDGKEPIVDISAVRKDGIWLFMIKDNGIGIPKEAHENIFVIFKRLHNRSKYSGTGIGLANCKKIVELHNGKIWVESQPGIGSTFYFMLNL